jgi:hypothetical protein
MAKKKAARVILGTVGVLAILGLSATVAYYANSSVKDWVDSEWSKLTDHDSTEKGSIVDEVTSPDGLMQVTIYSNQLQMAHSASTNSTKTAVATLNSEATDKRVKWTTADSTKVAVGSAYTNSGEAVTLTCKSIFDGSVAVTATAASDPSISCVYNCYVNNGVIFSSFCNIGIADSTYGALPQLQAVGALPSSTDFSASVTYGDSFVSSDVRGRISYNLSAHQQAVLFFICVGENPDLDIDVYDPDNFVFDGTTGNGDLAAASACVLEFCAVDYNPILQNGSSIGAGVSSVFNSKRRLCYMYLNDGDVASSSVKGEVSTSGSDGYIAQDIGFATLGFSKATSVTGGGDITF